MTDNELAHVEIAIQEKPEMAVPVIGLLVDLTNPPQVADALDAIRDAKRKLDEYRAMLEDVLRLEAQRQGTKTLHLPGPIDVVVSGGYKTDYDTAELAKLLREAGLPEARLAELVVETVTHKVDQRVAKSVAAANPAYAQAIEQAKTVEPAPWRVSVRRP